MSITRTINPVHFEDLEPHRFEDLVRQLMYDFKEWKSIEAIGRSGSDDGIDILAIESIINDTSINEDEELRHEDRLWIIQCKREKAITPKRIEQIVNHDLGSKEDLPFGYILVGSTNFSKTARDVFKTTLNLLGINEFFIFGKSELEDLLFLPKYDHLLFAYFGISIQKRKRSLKSELSTRLTTKRKLYKSLGDTQTVELKTVLVRSAFDIDYPNLKGDFKNLKWRFYYCFCYEPVDHICLITNRKYAYADWETGEWDIINDSDLSFPCNPELLDLPKVYYDELNDKNFNASPLWDNIDENFRGFYYEIRPIHFDRILLVDDLGDNYHEGPHLIVDYLNNSPFENKQYKFIKSSRAYSIDFIKDPKPDKRINIFNKNNI